METSCYLVEVAWQAYYDPFGVALDDPFAPGRQDLSSLGLELVVRPVLRWFIRSIDLAGSGYYTIDSSLQIGVDEENSSRRYI